MSVNSFMGNAFSTVDGHLRIEPKEEINLTKDVMFRGRGVYYKGGHFNSLDESRITSYIVPQEIAHIASLLPFTGKFENDSLLVHIDGGASDSNISVWYHTNGEIHPIGHSWDMKIINNFHANLLMHEVLCSKEQYHKGAYLSMPGKLMGYASYGKYDEKLRNWLVENEWFADIWYKERDFNGRAKRDFGLSLSSRNLNLPFFRNIAACIQREFTEQVIAHMERFQRQTGAKHLYYSGGGALNIITNTIIEQSGLFKSVHIPPCPDDSGLSLGAAALIEYLDHGSVKLHSPYLSNYGLSSEPITHNIDEVVDELAAGRVIGMCIGNGEIGPRALGHRSLLAIPSQSSMRTRVSEEIKQREWYRPLAPIIIDKLADKIFEGSPSSSLLSPYMLSSFPVRNEYHDIIPAVVHVDGTARAQVVSRHDHENSIVYEILKRLNDEHEILALINTSFNIRGKPIVHAQESAIHEGKTMGLDGVYLNDGYHKLRGVTQ